MKNDHRYGDRVHLISDPVLQSYLAQFSEEKTHPPLLNELLKRIYLGLFREVINLGVKTQKISTTTRMRATHPNESTFLSDLLPQNTPLVTVSLARAGIVPSQIFFEEACYLFDHTRVRQDHISISRKTTGAHQVVGSEVAGHKIGGEIEGSILLLPDPMGATGNSILEVLKLYEPLGKPLKIYAVHCIITPEYIRNILQKHSQVEIISIRLDRGLSSKRALNSPPGTYWDEERGLSEIQYIVPGAGGVGELLNNAFV